MDILKNIVEIRTIKGYSQEYIARKLGMKQAGYSLIESGERDLKYSVLLQIAIVFDMHVIDVILYPDKYRIHKENQEKTKFVIELDLTKEELEKFGIKDKILQVLEKL